MENQETAKPKFDPNKGYEWKDSDIFYMQGSEFGFLLQGLKAALSTPEAQQVMLMERAFQVMQNSLVRAVETGIAKEKVEPEPVKEPTPPEMKVSKKTKAGK